MPWRPLVLFGLALLMGCANGYRPSTVERAAPPPGAVIGIVASIPPQVRLVSNGVVSGLTLDIVDATDWHLDKLAEGAARDTLGSKYKIVPTRVSGYIVDTDTRLEKATNEARAIETQVRSQVSSDSPVDYYLVLCLGNAAQPYEPGPQAKIGIGVRKRYSPWNPAPTLHAYLQVSLLNARTDKVIATTPMEVPAAPHGVTYAFTENEPIEPLDGFEWHEHWSEMSDAQRQLIEDHIKAMISRGVPYTLKQMKLAP